MNYVLKPRPHLSLGALLAILCAAGSLATSCAGHPIWGLVLGILALPLGLGGLISSVSPTIRGGWASIGAMILGVIGVILAIVELIFKVAL